MDVRSVLFLSLIIFCDALYAASFDCDKATTAIEHAICDSEPLGELDKRLSQVFFAIKSGANSDAFSSLLNSQRSWLKQRNKTCGNYKGEALSSCLIAEYQDRIKRLDKLLNPKYPSLNEVYDVCHSVSDRQRIVSDNGFSSSQENVSFDINNDGQEEKSTACSLGTMEVACRKFFDGNGEWLRLTASDPRLIRDPYNMMSDIDYFRVNGKVYSQHYDDQIGGFIRYVSADNTGHLLCAWEYQHRHIIIPAAINEATRKICEAVDQGKVSYVHLSDPAVMPRSETFRVRGSPSRITGQGYLDINNDGKDELVAAIEYHSGAGRGCSYRYYDELSQDGKTFKHGRAATPLLQMQNVRFTNQTLGQHPGHPSCGGSNNRIFRYQGKLYVHMETDPVGEVAILKGDRFSTVCKAPKTTSSRFIYMWPDSVE
ncbi:hypothetical protein GCM10011297_31580 [Bacterioplanes sanyensis]|uniref:lysozyme inhibitor LprI family protein n=1 Tax=Bacterioplanes sanyensis TaxID=1249553 RepID=UPI0016780C68|nr:lysozyme inhibitor LprI family protein [Bacterioplanes sanyensis]GGY56460.1 hypothetical protein GCM10011297_31580 [Bacterioplanes sanyensis]